MNVMNVMLKRKHSSILCFLAVAFILMYREAMVETVSSWNTRWGAHGPLLLGVSLYLVWIKRDQIRSLPMQPALVSGALLLSLGCFVFFAGKVSSTIAVQQLSVPPVLLGAILLLAGPPLFKALLLPVGYLLFLTGFLEQLLGKLAIHFQLTAAWLAAQFLELSGFSVLLDNTLVMLPHITLEVARSCSGINHLVALLALALPLAYMTQDSLIRKSILVLSALFIGIFANGLRVALIGIYALFNKGADLHGPYETFYVTFIFFFGLLVLIIFSRILGRKSRAPMQAEPIQTSSPGSTGREGMGSKQGASILLLGLIFVLTFALSHLHTPKPVELERRLESFPIRMAGFTGKDLGYLPALFRPFPADSELMRRYENGAGAMIDLYIGYFRAQSREKKIIDYRRSWMHSEVSGISIPSDDKNYTINKTTFEDETMSKDVYFWYQMGDTIIRSEYAGKFQSFLDMLLTRKSNGAVVIIATRNSEGQIKQLLGELFEKSKMHLSGS